MIIAGRTIRTVPTKRFLRTLTSDLCAIAGLGIAATALWVAIHFI